MSERMTDEDWAFYAEDNDGRGPQVPRERSLFREARRARAAEDAERARAEMAEQTRDGLQKRVRELEAELEAAHYALVDAT